jgi:type I restriction enzyme, S subunit
VSSNNTDNGQALAMREPSAKYLAQPGYKQTEVGVIPEDWGVKPLHELAEKIMVGIASAATHAYRDRGVVMFRNQNIKPGFLDDSDILHIAEDYEASFKNKRLKSGDLLTARTGYPGTTSIVPPQYEGAQSFTTLITRPRRDALDSVYLCFFVNSEMGQRYFEQNQIGGGQKNVNAGSLKNFLVPIPPTKVEQQAIAEALSDADALIESLEQLLAKKRQVKQGAMQELLTGQKRLPGFAGEWEAKRLGDVAQLRKDRTDPRRTGTHEFCIELEHIDQGTGNLIGHIATGDGSSLKSVFREDDVLFGKLRAYLRKFWLAARDGVCSTEIWVLVAMRSILLPQFLFQLVKVDRFIEAASSAYGTHMPRSDWNVVKNYEVSLPSVAEQTAIATVLSDMDAELAALETKLAKARQLKQGMMQELLTGRIRLV